MAELKRSLEISEDSIGLVAIFSLQAGFLLEETTKYLLSNTTSLNLFEVLFLFSINDMFMFSGME